MRTYALCILVLAICCCSTIQAGSLLVDRPLPVSGLNDTAGGRSNVGWADGSPLNGYTWAVGDDFSVGTTGKLFGITDLRVWIVGDPTSTFQQMLSSLTLVGGRPGTIASSSPACADANQQLPCLTADDLHAIQTVSTDGTDPNVTISPATYFDGSLYAGNTFPNDRIWQVDFKNLNWLVQGGTLYTAFIFGTETTPGSNSGASPFVHSSNRDLSGNLQQGADNLMWEAAYNPATGTYVAMDQWNAAAGGLNDHSTDMNIQITGTPEPSTFILLVGALGAFAGLRKRSARQG